MKRMKKTILNICAVAVSAVLLASCNLDLFPNSAIAYDEDGQLIQTASNLKSFENGILASYRSYQNGEFYTISGQRVTAPKKGLYIVNGKKVLVK